jgi:hypothetical protein
MDDGGIDVALAHAPGDDLRVLRAEVEDDNLFHRLKGDCCGCNCFGEKKQIAGRISSGDWISRWDYFFTTFTV